ncbi:MAG: N-acetyltransferase [Chloroflexi bacterium]|nr:MAG: N-acetyltransferase [Chloroflexota bacterium]
MTEVTPCPSLPGPAYRIVTERLVIRCYSPADAPLLLAAIAESQEHLSPWMPWAKGDLPDLQSEIDRLRMFRGNFDLGKDFIYGIFSPDEQRILGGTGLHTRIGSGAREIGYWIHKDFINQGLATESSAALTKVAFEIDQVARVEIHCDPANVRSAAVPRKLGFTYEATLRQRLKLAEDTYRDSMIWSLLKEEYPSSPAAKARIEAYDGAGRKII